MINFDESLFFNLYKANLDLWFKFCQISQQGRHQMLELDERIISDSIEGTRAARELLSDTRNWQELAALPGDIWWRGLYSRFDEIQLATELFLKRHTKVTSECQQALADWQKASAGALKEAGNAMPLQSVLKDYWRNLGALGLSQTKTVAEKVAAPKSTTVKAATKKVA